MRRIALSAAVLTLALHGAPPGVGAQPARVPRIGLLCATDCSIGLGAPTVSAENAAFAEALQAHGYADRDFLLDSRGVGIGYDRLAPVAAELARRRVDVIVAIGSVAAARAAARATRVVPIVMVGVPDAVEAGLVATLARPGGNLTGVSLPLGELVAKQLELLKEVVPTLARIGVLWAPASPEHVHALGVIRRAAQTLQVAVVPMAVPHSRSLDPVVAAVGRERPGALLVLRDAVQYPSELHLLALRHRLPTISLSPSFAIGGGLMAFGASVPDLYRRAGAYIARILKGARPAELPVERPDRYLLVVNLNTARALGVVVPRSVLARADQLIE